MFSTGLNSGIRDGSRISQRGLDHPPRRRDPARTKRRVAITAPLYDHGDHEHAQRGANPGVTNHRRVNYRDGVTTREFTPA
jgi:hypothetical protein